MKKYGYKILIFISVLNFASCRKASKEVLTQKALKQLIYKSDDVAPILKANFQEDVLSKLSLSLDNSQIKLLAKQIDNNKPLAKLLNDNPKKINVWNFLSHSKYSNEIDAINYFSNLPKNQFILKTTDDVGEIIDVNSGNVLAKVSDEIILVTKLNKNPFLNLKNFAPKAVYKIKSTLYSIDDLGRVNNVKTPLLKINKNTVNIIDEGEHILSSKFGGVNLGINKSFLSINDFKQLNSDWHLALVNRKKISEVNIKPLYSDKSGIPDAFNVSYYDGQTRILKHIPNSLKKTNQDVFEQMKRPAIGKHIDGRTTTKLFPKDITLKGNKLFYNGKEFASIDAKTKTILVDRRAALKNGINPLLSHPKLLENYKYVVKDGKNTHIFKTDNFGRVYETEHNIKEIVSKSRNVVEQNNAKLYGDEVSSKTTIKNLTNKQHQKLSDEGGHFLADSAGGIPESINITSQAYKVNHSSKWRGLENNILTSVKNGDVVIVKNRQLYSDNSRRSSGAIIDLQINGKSEQFTFDNINNTLKDIQ
ncbi:DNA/RNA non-specific endonuclease [Bizionia paragorgiae]|uniref:DNA/RNA non-specific endonuclease n=2 Tax=Bizionia paragorgiae TaxID=283786 RepID=A0A1H3WUH0_BIZPA|nr:DNA/RNA non-specific endonuclease [Bizionia paragorgiae]